MNINSCQSFNKLIHYKIENILDFYITFLNFIYYQLNTFLIYFFIKFINKSIFY